MNHSRILCLAVALALLCGCQPRSATSPTDKSPPVATVNGTPISRDFYEFYIKGLTGKNPADITPEQRRVILENMIRAQLLDEQAVKEGVDRSGETPFMLEASRWNVLEQVMSDRYLRDRKPTEQELRAEYENQVNAMPKTEYHARHILVATEPFAQKVIERLDKGEKFDALAKELSMDSSKNNGGDLGWFTTDRMLPEFSGAVIALKPGEYTHKPVQTQFGWHVIQLLDTREVTPPPYDQVRQRLEQVVEAKKFRQYTDELMRNAKIERFLDQPGAGNAGAGPAAAPGSPPAATAPAATAPAAPAAAPAPTPAAAPPAKTTPPKP
jgi:peptidyl-prolyl cis-trans isomerase C